jgi:hypothetical protein
MPLNTKNYQIYKENKMAKIWEETLTIKLSKLCRNNETDSLELVNDTLKENIEEMIQQQFSDAVVVEVERG